MATATNRTASPALRGQSVKVTLDASETASKLPAVTIGQQATLGSSSAVGYVESVDYYGNSFTVSTKTPATNLASSSTPGVLAVGEVITLG